MINGCLLAHGCYLAKSGALLLIGATVLHLMDGWLVNTA